MASADTVATTAATMDALRQAEAVKSDNSGNYREPGATASDAPMSGLAAPAAVLDLAQLAPLSAKVTAQKSFGDESIAIYFYLPGPASYTVQQQGQEGWRDLARGVEYSGSGGLLAATLSPTDESIALRVVKLEGGIYTAVSPTFNIARAEVIAAGGSKTYRG